MHGYARFWESPPDLDKSPAFRLPVDREQMDAAKAMAADNKGARWAAGQALGLLVGNNVALREALGGFFWEIEGLPIATISAITGYGGREVREISDGDPISLFACLDCAEPIVPKDRRHLAILSQELRAICLSREGNAVVGDLLCQGCHDGRRERIYEERRMRRLAWQARVAELKRMPFSEYRLTPEWQAKRTRTLSRAGYRCQTCGARDTRLDVHHNTYENYGDERPQDLVALCERCHGLFHEGLEDAS